MTDSTDPRLEAGMDLTYRGQQLTAAHVRALLEHIDRADEAAGVRRVSQQELQDNLELARQGERQRIAEALAATRSLGDRPALLQHVDRLINSTVGAADSPVGGVS